MEYGACSGAVGPGTALQTRRSWVRFPMVTLEFFYLHNHPDRTMELGSIQPLTEMSARVIHVPINMKFGSLNLLEPSGPV